MNPVYIWRNDMPDVLNYKMIMWNSMHILSFPFCSGWELFSIYHNGGRSKYARPQDLLDHRESRIGKLWFVLGSFSSLFNSSRALVYFEVFITITGHYLIPLHRTFVRLEGPKSQNWLVALFLETIFTANGCMKSNFILMIFAKITSWT